MDDPLTTVVAVLRPALLKRDNFLNSFFSVRSKAAPQRKHSKNGHCSNQTSVPSEPTLPFASTFSVFGTWCPYSRLRRPLRGSYQKSGKSSTCASVQRGPSSVAFNAT